MEVDEEQFIRQENLQENVSKINRNIDETLENQARSKDDRIDESLSPRRESTRRQAQVRRGERQGAGFQHAQSKYAARSAGREDMIVEHDEVMIQRQARSDQFEN